MKLTVSSKHSATTPAEELADTSASRRAQRRLAATVNVKKIEKTDTNPSVPYAKDNTAPAAEEGKAELADTSAVRARRRLAATNAAKKPPPPPPPAMASPSPLASKKMAFQKGNSGKFSSAGRRV